MNNIRVIDCEIEDGVLIVTEALNINANRLLNWNELRTLNSNVEFMDDLSEQYVARFDE